MLGVHDNRVLQDLREERTVEFHYRRLLILNPDKLVDVAGVDPHLNLRGSNTIFRIRRLPSAEHEVADQL